MSEPIDLHDLIREKIIDYLKYMTVKEVVNDKFNGSIRTNFCIIKWDYSDSQSCCERYGVEFSFDSLDSLVGQSILKKIDLVDNDQPLVDYMDEGAEMRLVLSPEHYIIFYNYHNGYYCHTLDVKIYDLHDKVITHWNTAI